MNKFKQMINFSGSNFLIPMFITALLYTFVPSVLTLGVPFSGFFTTQATFFIVAVLIFVSGVQTQLNNLPRVLKSMGTLLLLKILLTVVVVLIWKRLFPETGLFGITVLSLTPVLLSLNPGMYLTLLNRSGITEIEETAFSLVNLLMLPAIPLIILSLGSPIEVSLWQPIFASIIPFILGLMIGHLFPSYRKQVAPLSMLLIPFLAVTFGAQLNLIDALRGGVSGLILTGLYYLLMVLPLTLFERQWNHNGGRMTLSMHSIATFSMSIPPYIAQYIPSFQSQINEAISQIAFGVIITSFLTPFLYDKFINHK